MKNILLSLFLLPSCFGVYVEQIDEIILHEKLAMQSAFSAIGALQSDNRFGTGTLIHPRVVLTAAHVLKGAKDTKFYLSTPDKVYLLRGKAICHPLYKGDDSKDLQKNRDSIRNDIALFILEKKVIGVKYPTLSKKRALLEKCYIMTGYGGKNPKTPQKHPYQKLSAKIIVSGDIYDGLLFSPLKNENELELFGTPRSGDSGGPLMTIDSVDIIHGILSCFTYSKEKERCPLNYAIYVSIDRHIDWIKEKIGDNIK